MVKEIWKDIPGYEGYYQVSNIGRVKGLERKVPHPTCGGDWKSVIDDNSPSDYRFSGYASSNYKKIPNNG